MSDVQCWGIFRERAHSPGRETDDELILCLTAKELGRQGYDVRIQEPIASKLMLEPQPFVFMMCERVEMLEALSGYEQAGGILVNTPSAVWNTYRERMASLLVAADLPFPQHRFTPTQTRLTTAGPTWVKRADVHNTQDGDVVFVPEDGDVNAALARLGQRGIERAMLQKHVEGDLIKFYGVGDPRLPVDRDYWFRWFYHKDQQLAGHPFDERRLKTLASRAAAAIGLEIFGGDAIVTADNELYLIDVNAWPSFALYREEAAGQIATHLASRFARAYAAKRA